LSLDAILLAWRNARLMPVTIVANLYWFLTIWTNACIHNLGEKLLSVWAGKDLVLKLLTQTILFTAIRFWVMRYNLLHWCTFLQWRRWTHISSLGFTILQCEMKPSYFIFQRHHFLRTKRYLSSAYLSAKILQGVIVFSSSTLCLCKFYDGLQLLRVFELKSVRWLLHRTGHLLGQRSLGFSGLVLAWLAAFTGGDWFFSWFFGIHRLTWILCWWRCYNRSLGRVNWRFVR
jgi:hypothetical protein